MRERVVLKSALMIYWRSMARQLAADGSGGSCSGGSSRIQSSGGTREGKSLSYRADNNPVI